MTMRSNTLMIIHEFEKNNVPLIQLPSVERDWLMADPSLSLSPVAPVDSALSLLKQ